MSYIVKYYKETEGRWNICVARYGEWLDAREMLDCIFEFECYELISFTTD